MKQVLKTFAIWRVWLFIPLLVAVILVPFRNDSLFTTLNQYAQLQFPLSSELVYPWTNFDGIHYIAIASRGYVDEGRFMPFYPMVLRAWTEPLRLFGSLEAYDSRIIGMSLVVSTCISFAAVYVFYLLLRLDYQKEVSQPAVLFLLAFPTAYILATVYSEGLFLLLSFMAFFAARQKKWLVASIICMFAAITRLSGISLIIPILYEFYISEVSVLTNVFKPLVLKKMSVFLLTPLLLMVYAFYNQEKWGDALYFVHAHGALGNSRAVSSIVFPVVTVYRYVKILVTVSPSVYEYWVALLEFVSLIGASIGVWFAWKQQQRLSYIIYGVCLLLLPLLSGTLTGLPRYVLPIFVFYSSLAVWSQKHRRAQYVLLGMGIVLQAFLLGLFVRGYYIT